MDSRDSTSSSVVREGSEDDGALSVTALLAKEAFVLFQSDKFSECVDVLNQLLLKKEGDPKIFIANTDSNSSASVTEKKRGWWTPLLFTAGIASVKYFYHNASRQNTLTQARRNISRHYDLYLDENKSLILKIVESQNSGKINECAENQARLQRNLMYLAAIADSQPQPATMHSHTIFFHTVYFC